MRILVAGGAGFIGSHLLDRLVARSDVDQIVIVDNLWTGLGKNFAHLLRLNKVEFLNEDVESIGNIGPFDEIYHLASPATPLHYMQHPTRTISANVAGAFRLLEQLKTGGLFCYTSTSEVYGDTTVSPQPESYRGAVDCTGPRAAYDESKRCVEALLFGEHRVSGTRVKVARVFNVYGPRTRADDGRAVSNFVSQALRGQPITVFGDGNQQRCWGFVDDIVAGLARFFWEDGADFPGPLNIGNDQEISVRDIAEFVRSRFPGSKIKFLPPIPQDPVNRRPDLTLARQILPGWECAVQYEEGIDRTISWFRREMNT